MPLLTARSAPTGLTRAPDVRNGASDGWEAAGARACHNFDMQDVSHLPGLVTGLAFVLAAVFGAVATRVNFCTMGAISDVVNFGDSRRLRMWVLAIAVAIAGAAALQAAGLVDLSKTLYTGSRIGWLSLAVGGFLFGFGMTLGSGCGSKTLIRVGGGNLKSLIVLVFFAISAYMTLKGLFALWRTVGARPACASTSRPSAPRPPTCRRSSRRSASAARSSCGFPFAFAAAIAAWVLANREFRATREMIVGGIVIGAVIVGGWYVSGHLGYVAEDPATLEEKFVATNSGRAESFSFTAPIAYLLELLIYWTDQSRVLTFGIAGVLGMLVGSAGMALATRTFRWEGFTTTEDLANHVVGGILMGFGGVTALGCTIGQGLSGVSTLALGSFLAVGAIVAGCVAALKYQMWRLDARRDCTGLTLSDDHLRSHLRARPPVRGLVRLGARFRAAGESGAGALPGLRRRERGARAVGQGARRSGDGRRAARRARTPEARGRRRACRTSSSRKLREIVRNTENVGRRFPEEARKIHYEEVPPRPIRGQASKDDADALREEGIEFASLPPFLTRDTH